MKRKIILILIAINAINISYGQELDSTQIFINEIEQSLYYQYGTIDLQEGHARIKVPDGLKFLDKEQSIYVLSDLWGNPVDSTIQGMLIPESKGVFDYDSWVFTITYEELGYINDEDAEDFDYDELEQDLINESEEVNPERIKQGYDPIYFIGWASPPYYDQEKKVLHWAKEYRFGEDTENTLNYNLQILGRKGVYLFNAISLISQFNNVDANIDKVLNSIEFDNGYTYFDFDPEIDEVAKWTIGGLVAGKILAKIGFFALLIKFWKVIAIGFISVFGFLWKKKKKNNSSAINKNERNNNE